MVRQQDQQNCGLALSRSSMPWDAERESDMQDFEQDECCARCAWRTGLPPSEPGVPIWCY